MVPRRYPDVSPPIYARRFVCVLAVLVVLVTNALSFGQTRPPADAAKPKPSSPKARAAEDFARHYEAARTFQISGDQEHAAAEYVAFLAGALGNSAALYAKVGDSDRATKLFGEALTVAPTNSAVRIEYGRMKLHQLDFAAAGATAEEILKSDPDNAQAHSLLGQARYAQGDYKGARTPLEAAVGAEPSFDLAYLLGVIYIKLNDLARARLVFDDMVTAFGDSARLHIYFGMAYREGEMYDNAIAELKKALAKDSAIRQAHYFLALAYLVRDGESGFGAAQTELQAEVKVSPNDARTHYLLGYIAMKQRNFREAETELTLSTTLDAKNPDPWLYLGQLYSDSDRDREGENAMRKAITLTPDEARNDFQISRAHYVLGRILQRAGKREEGEKELLLSSELRQKSLAAMRKQLGGSEPSKEASEGRDNKLNPASLLPEGEYKVGVAPLEAAPPEQVKTVQNYVDQLKPAIADSYNNLGVIQAGRKDFKTAASYFQLAGEWNPSLETLDRNWGMAAFYGGEYQEAIGPLGRQLRKNPDDVRVRAALGLSLFMLQQFEGALATLKAMESQVEGDPGLAYAYAVSLVKTGSYDDGVRRLKSIAESSERSAEIHMLLGSAYADQHEYETALEEYRKSLAIDPNQGQTHYLAGLALIRNGRPLEAIEDLRVALKLNSTDVSAKYHLAFALIQAQQKDEALTLLQQVIEQDPKRSDAYYELGKLQLERGDTKAAVTSLEAGTKLSPEADYIHYQLAMAYRRESRTEDAEREIKVYQELKNRQRGRGDAPQTN